MLLRILPDGYHAEAAVQAALSTVDDLQRAYEREGVEPPPGDGTVVLVATPDDALPDVIRRVTEALTTARRVRVKAS